MSLDLVSALARTKADGSGRFSHFMEHRMVASRPGVARRLRWWRPVALLSILVTLAAACGGDDDGSTAQSAEPAVTTAATGAATAATASASGAAIPVPGEATLRLGYFPNITHGTALVGVDGGLFAAALGPNVKLETQTFNAGPAEVEALLSGSIDAGFIGPNPAINAFAASKGAAIRIVAGTASGGASLVVKPDIDGAADLEGKKIATPQLGNTQDVALRTWLAEQGLETTIDGGGDVSVVPQDNAQTLQTFTSGDIDGAWVPEPWATRLVLEGKGKVLLDEATLWPQGKYVTTHLIVRTEYLRDHADVITALVQGLVDTTEYIQTNPEQAQTEANEAIGRITQKPLPDETIAAAWKNLTFTWDPIATSLETSADHATALGLLEPVDLEGIYDLGPLNTVLAAEGKPAVVDAGLGATA
jgi:NitT/TauT family transport system substrate-binding protein